MGVGAAVFAAAFVLLAVAYCVAGFHIRKARVMGAWIGIVCAALVSVLQLLAPNRTAAVGLMVNLGIVLLLVLNWRYLRVSSGQVGA